MPKFIVTSGSHFEPFSYDELVRPVARMQEAHNATQEAYDALNLETAALEGYLSSDENTDVLAKQLYKGYKEKLSALQDNLWKNGVTPQTRRDLSAARAGYAQDIVRLQNAVKTRAERSAAYWDFKNNNPDALLGDDPANASLDEYLNNPNFGQDYFRYKGDTLANDVLTDAKNRASELLSDPQILKGSGALEGYLLMKERDGYTSGEVSEAINAVRNAYSRDADGNFIYDPQDYLAKAKMSIGGKILAEVMYNNIDKIGITGNVSDEELDRAIGYAAKGVSGAIGQTKTSMLHDLVWAQQKKEEEQNKKNGSKQPKEGYTINDLVGYYESPTYRKYSKATKRQHKAYEGGDKTLFTPNGSSQLVSSAWDMTMPVFNPEIRQKVRAAMGGVDVGKGIKKGETYTINGIPFVVKRITDEDAAEYGMKSGELGFYENGKALNPDVTNKYNESKTAFEKHVEDYKKANPKINWRTDAYDPKKEEELREQYHIPSTVDTADVPDILETQQKVWGTNLLTLTQNDDTRKLFTTNIVSSMNYGASHIPDASTSAYAVYPVVNGRPDKKRGTVDITKVFGSKGDKKMSNVWLTPMDVAAGAEHGGHAPMEFSVDGVQGTFSGDAAVLLGEYVGETLTSPRPNYPAGWNMCDAVNYIMRPLMHPEEVMTESDDDSIAWSILSMSILNEVNDGNITPYNFRGAGIPNPQTGEIIPVTAKDVVRNPYLQSRLFAGVEQYIQDELGMAREDLAQDGFQSQSSTSSNPAKLHR